MASFRQDPYLWVHLAGLAAVPLCLDLCLAGLATAIPWLPTGLEIGLLLVLGTLPILWMQWQRPFYIFSLAVLALPTTDLTVTQLRLLRRFRSWPVRGLALLGALISVGCLWGLYRLAPLASTPPPLMGMPRAVGLGVAALGLLAGNLFLQIPLSVVGVLLTSPSQIDQLSPYPEGSVAQDFTVIGLHRSQILPTLLATPREGMGNRQAAAVIPSRPSPTTRPRTSAPSYEEHDQDDPWQSP